MKNVLLLLIFLLLGCSKERQKISDCTKIILPFRTYQEAKNTVESVKFKYTDEADTSKSSWIRGAQFYSCDGNSGYMIFQTNSKEYIHQGMPLHIWEEFKNAKSFGKYYNKNIKNHYRLIPQNYE